VLSLAWLASAAVLASGTGDLAVVRDGAVVAAGARIAAARDPAWSRDGSWLAYVGRRSGNPELYAVRLPGGRPVRLTFTPRVAESSPDWSPDGRRLVYARDGDLYVTTLDRSEARLLARDGAAPAWSPDGRRIAFERAGAIVVVTARGVGGRRIVPGGAPAWSPDGRRLVYELDGDLHVTRLDRPRPRLLVERGRSPSVGSDGRIAFARLGSVWAVSADGESRARLRAGKDPDWRPRPALPEVLPDLDQLEPRNPSVIVQARLGQTRFLLGFTSAVVNAGPGPLEIHASRPSADVPVMTAAQRVLLADGRSRTYRGAGLLRYKHADDHLHWHYLAFEAYELRRLDGTLAARDRKSGFCLVDRRGPPGGRAVFTGDCAWHDRAALRLREGTSVGFVDVYPAHFHGQNLDVTDLPGGLYVLVHRANPRLLLREADYTNNAASLLVRLSWPGGRQAPPRVSVLRRCPAGDRCAIRG